MRRATTSPILAITFAAALSPVAFAQAPVSATSADSIAGLLRDSLGAPVQGAEVRHERGTATSDSRGRFAVASRDDTVRVSIRKLGFEPVVTFIYRAGSSPADSNVVTLFPLVQRLDRVIVEGVPYDRELWERGFYRRQQTAHGVFFDPEEMRIRAPAGLPAILHTLPRVRIERAGTQEFALGNVAGRSCRMHVYMNGMYFHPAMTSGRAASATMGLREIVHPDDIHAMEVYPNANTVPTQFARKGLARTGGVRIPSPGKMMAERDADGDSESPCGVILIWTKSFVERANAQRAREAAKDSVRGAAKP